MLLFSEVENLLPLYREIKWLEGLGISGGALHIVVEDGNYKDSDVQHCIDWIRSGNYREQAKKLNHNITEDDIVRQLAIAEKLLELCKYTREMVCEGNTITEELFNFIYNTDLKE